MWWIILGGILGAVILGRIFTRTTTGERRRSAQWSDLHTRGRLMTSQLAQLREAEGRRDTASRRPVPRGRLARRGGFLWRRRGSALRAGGSPSDPQAGA